ncbi:MAG: ornithine carbamoyltransferase [Clostridia bacterium]|nr:ornithine carbamoyltransferase [Clostridia bacterium]
MNKDLLSLHTLSCEDIYEILDLADKLKAEHKAGIEHHILKGKTLGMIFAKSSTRTRVSFEVGMSQLGGHALFLSCNDIQLGRGETIYDTAKVLSRFLDGIMIRTFSQEDVEELAKHASIPVINGLTDLLHPCQVLADLQTIREYKGTLKGLKMCYIGDGNNMTNTLIQGAAKVGMDISCASPKGYTCDMNVVMEAEKDAIAMGSKIELTTDPEIAIKDADIIYTDTWVSMGQEEEKAKRIKDFEGFEITPQLMKKAKSDAIFMHCLPVYRGYEASSEVVDGPQSVIFDEAENRLHAQKAVLVKLMGNK